MDTVSYPARLILDRYNAIYTPPALVIVDEQVIESDADLAEVLAVYHNMELVPGAVRYTKTLAAVEDLERVVAERWAALEALANPAPDVTQALAPSALERAYLAARAAYSQDRKALKRLQEALPIVRGEQVREVSAGQWLVVSYGEEYRVNGGCTCAD